MPPGGEALPFSTAAARASLHNVYYTKWCGSCIRPFGVRSETASARRTGRPMSAGGRRPWRRCPVPPRRRPVAERRAERTARASQRCGWSRRTDRSAVVRACVWGCVYVRACDESEGGCAPARVRFDARTVASGVAGLVAGGEVQGAGGPRLREGVPLMGAKPVRRFGRVACEAWPGLSGIRVTAGGGGAAAVAREPVFGVVWVVCDRVPGRASALGAGPGLREAELEDGAVAAPLI